jgi:single-stranded DNA-binding protein
MAGTTNHIVSIVKLLENPRKKILKKNISVARFRVQLPQSKKERIINLTVWGKLANDIEKYYRTNDYIIVEGFISIKTSDFNRSRFKIVEITVSKIYPYLLNYNHSITKK